MRIAREMTTEGALGVLVLSFLLMGLAAVGAAVMIVLWQPKAEEAATEAQRATEELELCRKQAMLQAATIASLRREVADYATKLGEQGREIARLMALVKQHEATLASLREEVHRHADTLASSTDTGQFRSLRALIVKELHPDHTPEGSVDRALRAEVFKAVWPKIEEIAGR